METKIEGALSDKVYQVTMEDGSKWQIPLVVIAMDHAKYYAKADEVSYTESYENTCALFRDDDYEAKDWARGNMNWSDVVQNAIMVQGPEAVDHQEGWINGESAVIDL